MLESLCILPANTKVPALGSIGPFVASNAGMAATMETDPADGQPRFAKQPALRGEESPVSEGQHAG